jgi:hypothetical protein
VHDVWDKHGFAGSRGLVWARASECWPLSPKFGGLVHRHRQFCLARVPRGKMCGTVWKEGRSARFRGVVGTQSHTHEHSRAGANPVCCSWIPGLALLAQNDGLPHVADTGPCSAWVSRPRRKRWPQVSDTPCGAVRRPATVEPLSHKGRRDFYSKRVSITLLIASPTAFAARTRAQREAASHRQSVSP